MTALKMKAIICTKYGAPEVLQIKEVNRPTIKADEILVKVHATSVTTADTMMRNATPWISRLFLGFTKPKNNRMGTGFAGRVVAIGKNVDQFEVGDPVFGETGVNFGANAEYVAVPEAGVLALKPNEMTYEEAAPICDGALTSLNFLKELGNIRSGQKVLINGASGSLGTAAVQIAKYYGAEVTGVCSGVNRNLVKSLGATKVINYKVTDFTESGEKYDIIYDTVGKRSFSECKKVLTENGIYLSPVLNLGLLVQMLWTSIFGTKKAKFSATGMLPPAKLKTLLEKITALIELGKLKSVLDRQFSLQGAVEAHRYVDSGRKKGNVVIKIV